MSKEVKTLEEAILHVQNSAPIIGKEKNNPFFKSKYADLPTIWKAIKDLMHEAGICVTTLTDFDAEGREFVTTYIRGHGSEISSRSVIMLGKRTAQEYGSFLTYIRRYHLSSMLGLQVDEDDDGNAASKKEQPKPQPPKQDPMLDTCANIKKQLNDADNIEVLDYVWNGFKAKLNEIKAAKPKWHESLEAEYKQRKTDLTEKEK